MRNNSYIFLSAIIVIAVTNALDAWFTLVAIDQGLAEEANPIMAHLLHKGEMYFIIFKCIMVSIGLCILIASRDSWSSYWATIIIAIVLLLLTAYHISYALTI